MSIYTMKFIQEDTDVEPVINKYNIAIVTKHNGVKMMENASWNSWEKIFIFPDAEKAEHFVNNYDRTCHNYKECMLKDNYIFHIINCEYPEPKEIYVDQMRMSKDYEPFDITKFK